MFVSQIVGLLLLRTRYPDFPRPFRMWLYPLPALFAMAAWLYIFVMQAFNPRGGEYMLCVLSVIGTGGVLYLALAKRQRIWPFMLRQSEVAAIEEV
jgi:hypothetical protein